MARMYLNEILGAGTRLRTWLAILTAPALTACAHFADQGSVHSEPRTPVAAPAAPPAAPATPAEKPATSGKAPASPATASATRQEALTDQTLFDILLGEIAGQRGRLDVAASHYLEAALNSNDPRVAERAVQIATFARKYDIALRAARRWQEVDGGSVEARKVVTALALKLGDTTEVITQLNHLIATSANPQEGFHLATVILAQHADKSVALEAMEKLAARYPDSVEAQLAVCRIAVLAENLDRARTAVDRALQMQPGLPQALVLKAQILIRQDEKQEALKVLEEAVAREPKSADLHLAYGRMLLDAGNLEGAREQFRVVVKLTPDNADAVYSLALLELETGQLDSARRHLKALLNDEDKQQSVYYYLGYVAQEKGDNDVALKWYGKVEEGNEYWTQAQLRRAKILAGEGRLDEVRKQMQSLRRNNPENAVDYYLIEGQALSDLEMYQKAYDLYAEALENHPQDEDLLYAQALTAEQLDHVDAAEHYMLQILKQDPNNVRALNALGYTLADRTHRYAEAQQYIEKAYAQKPDDPAVIDSMGWIQYRLGNLTDARRYLQQAYDMTGDAEIGAHLGEVLWKLGDQTGARRVWQESLEAAPDNPVLKKVMNRFMP
jgi:tetratricopeptide (TPR) repeat protein